MAERNLELYHLPENCIFLVSQKALIVRNKKFLLLKFIDLDGREGKWELPGGLKEWGEDPEKGLIREIREETGLCVNNSKLLAVASFPHENFFLEGQGNRDADIYTSIFICDTGEGDIQLSHEHSAYVWSSYQEALNLDLTASAKYALNIYSKSSS